MFDDVLEANRRFRAGFRDSGMAGTAAKGLAVLTCIDSRIDPLAMLGLQPGDAKIIRNAGARVTDDALRSLVLAVNLLGVTRVALVHHTECAVIGSSEAEMREKVEGATGQGVDGWDFLASDDQRGTMAADLDRIRTCPLLPDDLEVAGFVFDVRTGELMPVEEG
jgi:carbonic anhydrase